MSKILLSDRLQEIEGWRTKDLVLDLLFPWYTRPFLKELVKWNISNWKVFEYGAGDSTHWWRKNCSIVHAVDSNESWAKNTSAKFLSEKEKYLKYPMSLIDDEKFDCIIIDGEPTEWRDSCTEHALQSVKNKGIIIIDNYEQGSVNLSNWPITNNLLQNYEKHVFQEPKHSDWKTAYWTIK
jgi:hypothetical protein